MISTSSCGCKFANSGRVYLALLAEDGLPLMQTQQIVVLLGMVKHANATNGIALLFVPVWLIATLVVIVALTFSGVLPGASVVGGLVLQWYHNCRDRRQPALAEHQGEVIQS